MVAIEDYPINLMLPVFSWPALLTGKDPVKWGRGLWHKFFTKVDGPLLARKYGLTQFATSSVDTLSVARSLAKIAHSFAVTTLGLDGFEPVLCNYIQGREDLSAGLYVGSWSEVPPAEDSGHQIQLSLEAASNGTLYLVASIRLFSWFGAPVYHVVVGTELADRPLAPALMAMSTGSRRIGDRTGAKASQTGSR